MILRVLPKISTIVMKMFTCFILMLPTFVSGGWAAESSGRMLDNC